MKTQKLVDNKNPKRGKGKEKLLAVETVKNPCNQAAITKSGVRRRKSQRKAHKKVHCTSKRSCSGRGSILW